MNRTRWSACLLGAFLVATGHAEEWRREAALAEASSPTAAAEIQRLLSSVPWSPQQVVADDVERIMGADLPAPARERILYEFAFALRDLPPQSHVLPVLDALTEYQAAVLVPSEFTRHPVPLYNVAAAAAGTLHAWAAETQRDLTLAALDRGNFEHFDRLAGAPLSAPEIQGLRQAISAISPAELEITWPAWQTVLEQRPEAASLAEPLSRAFGDARALETVARFGTSVPLVARADDMLPADQAVAFWKQLASSDLPGAGPSMVRLAEYGELNAAKTHRVVHALADPQTGADMALALARGGAVDVLAAVALDADQPELARKRAALGLKLEGSDGSRTVLKQLQADPSAAGFADEVAKWVD